jgi:hypothetical protein
MGTQCVVCHQLLGHLPRQVRLKPSGHIDGRQFAPLRRGILFELGALALEVGTLGVRLRMDRHVFAGGHRHGSGDQPRHAGQ